MTAPTITVVDADRCDIGESPVWDERANLLWWVDTAGRERGFAASGINWEACAERNMPG